MLNKAQEFKQIASTADNETLSLGYFEFLLERLEEEARKGKLNDVVYFGSITDNGADLKAIISLMEKHGFIVTVKQGDRTSRLDYIEISWDVDTSV